MLTYLVRCAIWYYSYNLKNVKNTHRGVLLLVKLQASACNFTKSNTPPWVFFTFFKLYEQYQIVQRTTYLGDSLREQYQHRNARRVVKGTVFCYVNCVSLLNYYYRSLDIYLIHSVIKCNLFLHSFSQFPFIRRKLETKWERIDKSKQHLCLYVKVNSSLS